MNVHHLLTQEITIAARSGTRQNSGDANYGSQSTITCRIERKVRLVRGPDGNELSTAHVIVTATEIAEGTRIWLPGATTTDTNAALVPVARGSAQTPGGQTLWETYL